MDNDTTLTRDIAICLLNVTQTSAFIPAEHKRSWSRKYVLGHRSRNPGSVLDELWDSLLTRTYDMASGSQPGSQRRMFARDARMRLDTEEIRHDTLARHANHRIWEDTPYISFTKSQTSLQDLAEFRSQRKRGSQNIIVVDPRVRFDLGLPVLQYSKEMAYYKVEPPYERGYWEDHFLYLWEVIPEEVVGIWDWDRLRSEKDWLQMVIMPAVEQHRETRKNDKVRHETAVRSPCTFHPMSSQVSTCSDMLTVSSGLLSLPNPDVSQSLHDTRRSDVLGDVLQSSSDTSSDDDALSVDSEDSYEKVCNENWTGELMNMYEDLRLE